MVVEAHGINDPDWGAVPHASTTSTNALAAPEMTYAGEYKSGSAFDGGETGSTGCSKRTSRPKAKKLNAANDNAPFEMALAA